MPGWIPKIASLAAVPALMAVSWSYFSSSSTSFTITNLASDLRTYLFQSTTCSNIIYHCDPSHSYTTQIISLDPLVIYIHNFLPEADINSLLETASPKFKPSVITRAGRTKTDPDRTSVTAFLPASDEAVSCVLNRARAFAGTLLEGKEDDEMGMPQLVRYTEGQKFNLHYDWYNLPQRLTVKDGTHRFWNRVGSFFAILEDGCEEGETWFPNVTAITGPSLQLQSGETRALWRAHEKGGLAFRPVKGNALFWMNLDGEGKGDTRVKHAGLPVTSGRKTAMNIWPRRYFYK
jgi:prolyl 4-hydroxylase